MKHRNPILFKTIFLMFLAVSAVVYLSAANYRRFRTAVVSQTSQYLFTHANAEAVNLQMHFQDITSFLQTASGNSEIRRILTRERGDGRASTPDPDLQNLFSDIQDKLYAFLVIDKDGIAREALPRPNEGLGKDFNSSPDVAYALRNRTRYFNGVHTDEKGKRLACFSFPVFGEREDFLGLAHGAISVDSLTHVIDRGELETENDKFLISPSGTVVFAENKDLIGKDIRSPGVLLPEVSGTVRSALNASRSAKAVFRRGGLDMALICVPIQIAGETWMEAMTFSQESISRTTVAYARNLLIIIGLFLIVLLWAGALFYGNERRRIVYEGEAGAKKLLEEKNMQLTREILEREAAQAELVGQRRNLQALLDNIPDMVWLKDTGGRFVIVNKAFAASAGCPMQEVIGKNDLDVWERELAEKFVSDDREVMTLKISRKTVEPIKNKLAGPLLWLETVKTPVFSDDGEVVGTVGIAREMTERKRYEDHLNKLNRMFIGIGPDFDRNIQKYVDTCGEVFSADIVSYLKIKEGKGFMAAGWRVPAELSQEVQNSLCMELLLSSGDEGVRVVRDIDGSRCSRLYPIIESLRLRTFVGYPLRCSGELIGALCVFYSHASSQGPSENERRMLEIIGAAICIEEERKNADEKLKAKMFDLERFNRFAIDREMKMIELKRKLAQYEERQ